MPPVYSVAVTAFALGVSEKWVDNVLSHHDLPGVIAARQQGVQRGISERGVLAIELVRKLGEELNMPVAAAALVARRILENPSDVESEYVTPSAIRLSVPVAALEHSLRDRLRDALEAVPPRPRGRPPLKKKNAER